MLSFVGVCAFLSPGESLVSRCRFVYMGSVEAWKILVQGRFFFLGRVVDLEMPLSSRNRGKSKRRIKLGEYCRVLPAEAPGTAAEVLRVYSSPFPGLWHPGGSGTVGFEERACLL